MKIFFYQINQRWSADGNSSYDPKPVLAHHLYHMLFASTVALIAIHLVGIQPLLVGTVYSVFWIVAEGKQWRDGANFWDCVFDAYQHQIVWTWCLGLWGILYFVIFVPVYFWLLIQLVDANGNARKVNV